jgi:hypothetical protein
MNKKYFFFLVAFGLIISLINGCEKENNTTIENSELLTNGSSKIWCLSKIVIFDTITINPSSCIVDDEYKFLIDGKCLISNMGTVYSNSPIFDSPPFCKDTIEFIGNASWTLNTKMDTLTISTDKYVIVGKILSLTSDSLIINRTYSNSDIQTEYYVAKKE